MRSSSTCPPSASWSVIAIPARPNSIALSISSFGLTVESISRKLVKNSACDYEYQIAALSLASPSFLYRGYIISIFVHEYIQKDNYALNKTF